MKLLKHDDAEGHPCNHMEGLLNRAADGSGNRFWRWYALAHAAKCDRCGRFLSGLRTTIERLRSTKAQEPNSEAVARIARDFVARRSEE